MKYTWTTKHTLDITNEEFEEMAREAQELEDNDGYDTDEAVSTAVQDYLDSLVNDVIYVITEKIVQEIEMEVVAYLNNKEGE